MSATLSDDVKALKSLVLHNPVSVSLFLPFLLQPNFARPSLTISIGGNPAALN